MLFVQFGIGVAKATEEIFDLLPALKDKDSWRGGFRIPSDEDMRRVCQHPVKTFSVEKGYV